MLSSWGRQIRAERRRRLKSEVVSARLQKSGTRHPLFASAGGTNVVPRPCYLKTRTTGSRWMGTRDGQNWNMNWRRRAPFRVAYKSHDGATFHFQCLVVRAESPRYRHSVASVAVETGGQIVVAFFVGTVASNYFGVIETRGFETDLTTSLNRLADVTLPKKHLSLAPSASRRLLMVLQSSIPRHGQHIRTQAPSSMRVEWAISSCTTLGQQ
jgi:hypothetical protein